MEDHGNYVTVWLLAIGAAAALSCSSDSRTAPADCSDNGGGQAGQVTVGNNFFRSNRNGTCNTAIDTIQAGGSITWTWTGTTSHGVRSLGAPGFPSSNIMTGAGQTYSVTFDAPGTYQYDCPVHPSQMTGRIVVP
jgi:plastocyanin